MYREIVMEKQANTGKIKKKTTKGKQAMRMTIVERKLIAC
jgi:hypothetical protein